MGRYVLGAKRKKSKKLIPRLLYQQACPSEVEEMNFPDKQKLRKFNITRTDKKKLQGAVKAETKG